jgi:hypothetical protein
MTLLNRFQNLPSTIFANFFVFFQERIFFIRNSLTSLCACFFITSNYLNGTKKGSTQNINQIIGMLFVGDRQVLISS